MDQNPEVIKGRSKIFWLLFSILILVGLFLILYPGDLSSRRFSGTSKIVYGFLILLIGIGGLIYFSLPHKLVVDSDGFEFWVGWKLKFRSDYNDIREVECKKTIMNLAHVPIPESSLIVYTTKGTLFLSANKHLSKTSLMTFLRKLEEKSFQYRDIEIKDKLNWLYQ